MPFPVDELLPQLNTTLQQNLNVVLQAPPGAGKTTRVPLALLTASWLADKKIIMLEPRRIAARAAARFMAGSLGEGVGETVGYRVRQDSKLGPKTRIEVVTEGILTRMLQDDPALESVGVVIFDEFHERNLNSDLALALCLDAQQGLRDDLRLIVMSATLDGAEVARLLDNAPVLTSEGRSYPVALRHQPVKINFSRDRRGFLQAVVRQIMTVLQEEQGSVLVFLPGAGEIQQVYTSLQESIQQDDIILAPLFGQLSADEQDAAIQPAPEGKRKLVLATSIAETSLTIDGIRIVIDSGLMRSPRFDANTGLSQLVTLSVSQAGAAQRCGRAGRTQAGVCYRLWSAATHLVPHTNPEILDADLAALMLELAQWGVADVQALRWLDTPPAPHVSQAVELLQQLGALDDAGRITRHGAAMVQWGVHPRLAHMMLRGKEIGVGSLACEIAALLSERDVLRGRVREADLQLRVEALRDRSRASNIDQAAIRQVRQTAQQWQRQLKVTAVNEQTDLALGGVLLAYAYPDRIARQRDNDGSRYLLSNGRGASLNEGDMLSREEYVIAAHLAGGREARIFLAAAITREQLESFHADLIQTQCFVSWDPHNNCVQARRQQCIGELILDDAEWRDADAEAVQQALLEGIQQQGLNCLPWNDRARELQARVNFLHAELNEPWPDLSDATLLATLDDWLSPYLTGMSRLSHLQRLDLYGILLARLPWALQNSLNELAPTHLVVPSGSRVRLDYRQSPPVLAVRLQEMFGLTDTPRIANGRVAVLLHLLSPARRAVQITQDLAGFWQSSYHDVKKDLKGRYPKHHWPDDPVQAQPTAKQRGQ